jgi:GNAT superfamily N-acetyltransferase
MIDLFNSTGRISEDIELFKTYLDSNYKSDKLIITKNREKMYLVHENGNLKDASNYNGRIYVLSDKGIIGLLEYEAIKSPYIITIKNIQFKEPDYYGKGIGTSIIKYLQEYALKEKIVLIKGILEQYDIDHYRETLMNFYSKHDFNVDFYHKEVKKIIDIKKTGLI